MVNPRLKVAIKAVTTAGELLRSEFRQNHHFETKADGTVLIEQDIKSEDILINTISKKFPADTFFTEEKDLPFDKEQVWVFDPICGSYSYLRGVETWSLSMAYIENGGYTLGIVYLPLLDYLFYADKGDGAYLNQHPIYPSTTTTLSDSFISVEHGVFKSDKYRLVDLIKTIKRIRVGHGSGGELAYVAAGFIDGLIKTDQTLMHFAGGRAVVEISGGKFVDFQGRTAPTYLDKTKSINYVACTPGLVRDLLSFVNK